MDSDLLSRYAGHDAQTIAALGHYEYLYHLAAVIDNPAMRWTIVCPECKHCAHIISRLRDIFL